MIDVIERIKELMTLKGWSPYELSNQIDVSANAVYDWYNTGAMPTMQNIIKVCNATGITLEQFFCNGIYKYTDEENEILKEWLSLSDLERAAVSNLMETFRIIKNG